MHKPNIQQNLIIIAMGAAVPRHAIGYVADLASPNLVQNKEVDCLAMLRRYCPGLVDKYIAAQEKQA